MLRYLMLLTLTAGLTAGPLTPPAFAAKVPQAGQMTVDDEAKAFTPDGIKDAENKFHGKTFKSTTHFHVRTVTAVPEGKKKDFDAAKESKEQEVKSRFFLQWAKELAKADHDRGVFTFIYMSEDGQSFYVVTIADSQTDRSRGFDDSDARKTSEKLREAFRSAKAKTGADAQKVRDGGLMDATNYVIDQLKNTSANDGPSGTTHSDAKGGGSSILTYVCIGIFALMAVWLVIGLIRAFTGGGGGGGGYGGGGYGGGGGGFMTSMLGGLFGAAAGMYLYDQFLGHHGSSDLNAGQSNDYDNTSGDNGAGDFDGGSAGGGGDFGDSGGGGGDFGGGDFGGGDFGGGGGDFGGGDF